MDVCLSSKMAYWPQITDYERLYRENPSAVFILNKRDPVKILSSFKRWGDYDKRFFKFNPELIQNKSDIGLIHFILQHFNKIETFFKERPAAKFISYDINLDTIDKLKKYIDIKNIKEMPHENRNLRISKN